jgi:hypothetical protein
MAKKRTEEGKGGFTLTVSFVPGPAVDALELIVKGINDAVQRHGEDSIQAEFGRGQLHGAKWILALVGKAQKDQVMSLLRQRVGPIPTTAALAADGKRYGFDSDEG